MTLAGVVIMAVALVLLREFTVLLLFGVLLVVGQEMLDYFFPPRPKALPSTPPTKEKK